MKILANKEIKNLFLSLSLVFGVTFLLAEVFSMAVISTAFSVIANPFSIGWRCCMGSLLCIF